MIYSLYFSPTGGTKKVLRIVEAVWDGPKTQVDLLTPAWDAAALALGKDDLCFVAVPSFGGRVPDVAIRRLAEIRGGGARAVLIAVYGNRAYDDTLLELLDTLEKGGFRCAAAVAAVAEH